MDKSGDNYKNPNEEAPNPLQQYAYENNYGRIDQNDPYNPVNRVNLANYENAPQQTPPNFMQNSQYMQQPQPQPMPQPQVMQAPTPMMAAPQPMQAPTPVQPKKKSHIGEIILIIFIFIIAGGAVAGAIYCFNQYDTLNRQVLADRGVKVNNAKAEQKELDEQNYERRSAKTTREFTGPSNFGALTFEYPKEWNVYIDNDSSTEPTFAAYFSPEYVKATNSAYQGLEFKINSQNYDATIKNYAHNLISEQNYSANGLTGKIFKGKLDKKEDSKDGVAVVIKINNYSAIIQTRDYETYGEEFDKIINTLKSANYE
jgi:hypothetical protein